VLNQEIPKIGQSMNLPGTMQPMNNIAGMNQSPYNKAMPPMPAGAMHYQLIYPEIFYRLQPYIMMVCDEMDMYGSMMPTQEMIEQITDSIYDDICRMYPDMDKYANDYAKAAMADPPKDEDGFRRRFRRRGMARDLIDILLLSEFFNRRRHRSF
jgi:hypothetical protein